MSMCQSFCRGLLTSTFEVVKKHVPVKVRKSAWVYKFFNTYEFHIPKSEECPKGFYTTVRADCKWSARAYGWCKYLDHLGIELDETEEI